MLCKKEGTKASKNVRLDYANLQLTINFQVEDSAATLGFFMQNEILLIGRFGIEKPHEDDFGLLECNHIIVEAA